MQPFRTRMMRSQIPPVSPIQPRKQTIPATAPSRTWLTAAMAAGLLALWPETASATQMHSGSEGIIVHQLGHMFFTLSMIILIFTISGKGLNRERGWKLIQYSAFMFTVWNLDTIAAHFLDNQIDAVTVTMIPSSLNMTIAAESGGTTLLPVVYYLLKMDHLLCVPAIFLFYRGLVSLLNQRVPAGRHQTAASRHPDPDRVEP